MPGTFPTISSGTPFRYPITRSRTQRAVIHTYCDFSETRYLKGPATLTEFALQYQSITLADKEILRLFYAAQGGELATDWTLLFDGTTYTNCQFVGPFEAKNIGARLWSVTLKIRSLPQLTVVSATLFAITSHAPGSPSQDTFAISSNGPIVSLFQQPNWINDTAAWSQRTDTLAVPPNAVGSINVIFSTWSFSGGLGGTPFDTPDIFLVYEVWLQVTLSNGTVLTQRPTNISTELQHGTLENPGNAIDGDPSTFATITTTVASTLGFGPAFSVSAFQ
jgi:hypothetical protein